MHTLSTLPAESESLLCLPEKEVALIRLWCFVASVDSAELHRGPCWALTPATPSSSHSPKTRLVWLAGTSSSRSTLVLLLLQSKSGKPCRVHISLCIPILLIDFPNCKCVTIYQHAWLIILSLISFDFYWLPLLHLSGQKFMQMLLTKWESIIHFLLTGHSWWITFFYVTNSVCIT